MKTSFLVVVLASVSYCTTARSQLYTTRFEGAEDPLSEDGRWHNDGGDWARIRKANGIAFGTQSGTNSAIYQYDDSYAHLSGFPPDQEAWGEVHIAKPNAACNEELEILLRWTSTPHRTTGYECFARCLNSEASYLQIVRWEGPLGKFTYLADKHGANYGLNNGDILQASIVGNVITVYVNGTEKAQVTDDTYKTGDPGMGEFLGNAGPPGASLNSDFGFASFTARGLAGPLECFATSDLERVFEDGYGPGRPRQTTLSLFGLRNETVSGQCVLVARTNLENVRISVGPLRQRQGESTIAETNVSWNFIDNIYIEKNSPNRAKATLSRPAPAWFPDYLGDEPSCALPAGTQRGVYLTIKIPPETPAGEYQTTITVRAGNATASLPVMLQVYPLALPDARHLLVTEWYSTGEFKKHHQLDPSDAERFYHLLGIYAQNMAEHRQNGFRVGWEDIERTRTATGQFQFDFSRFDKLAELFWNTGRMDWLETGFVAGFGKGGWSSTEIGLDKFAIKEANGGRTMLSGEEFLPQFLPAFVSHLRAKGWLAKTRFHICDEPSNHNIMAWRVASDFVHRAAPELRRIDAIETPHCLGALETWVPKLDHLAAWQEAYQEAQRQGNELWFYTVGIYQGGSLLNKTADVPLIESRLMHWLNYRYHLQGYLHWGFNAWTEDPIRAPGEHRGDGWQVYPRKDGLLNSVRWEQMRNGLQDYECLWLLENRISQIKASLPPRVAALIDPRQRGVEIASSVVADFYEHTSDPEVLYQARRQAIEETIGLEQSPRVLLQTVPAEYTRVAKGCVVDIHGWAEPGTILTANGQPVPVAADGLFLAELTPSAEGRIVVAAQSKAGKKSFLRNFREILDMVRGHS